MTETLRGRDDTWNGAPERAPFLDYEHSTPQQSSPEIQETRRVEFSPEGRAVDVRTEVQKVRDEAYEAFHGSIVGRVADLYHAYATIDVDERGQSVERRGEQADPRQLSPHAFWQEMRQFPVLDRRYVSPRQLPPAEAVAFTPANVSRDIAVRDPENVPEKSEPSGVFARTVRKLTNRFRTKKRHKLPKNEDVARKTMNVQKHMPVHDGYIHAVQQTEPAVNVDYMFDGVSYADSQNAPLYLRDQSSEPSYLAVRMQLPQSVANELSVEVRNNPQVIRQLVEAMILKQQEQAPEAPQSYEWRGELDRTHHRGRPPYEQLPENWKLHMFAPDVAPEAFDARHPQISKTRYIGVEAPGRAPFPRPNL